MGRAHYRLQILPAGLLVCVNCSPFARTFLYRLVCELPTLFFLAVSNASSHIPAGWSPGQHSAVPGEGGDSSKPGRTSWNKPLLGTGRSQGLRRTLLGAFRHSRGPCTLLGVQTKGGSSVHTRHPHSHHKLLH